MVSHELRTPLTSIRGFAEVLAEDGEALTPLERTEFTDAIAKQAAHLSRLVDDVFAVMRIDAAKLTIRPETMPLMPLNEAATAMIEVKHRRESTWSS